MGQYIVNKAKAGIALNESRLLGDDMIHVGKCFCKKKSNIVNKAKAGITPNGSRLLGDDMIQSENDSAKKVDQALIFKMKLRFGYSSYLKIQQNVS